MTTESDECFLLKGRDAEAVGFTAEEGFIVEAGSIARKDSVPSLSAYVIQAREHLVAEQILEEHDGQLRFTISHTFNSPSGAAAAVLARPCNGWTEWKHTDGRTLSEVMRVTRSSDDAMLSESKRAEILTKSEQLISEGKIYTKPQLDQYYSIFRERFGPEVLRGLDGEALLALMHDHGNRDSLVYWLEFKSDEDFDTKRFGSIAGGSALKFRIFRRKETGHWQSGSERNKNKPQDITIEEAVEIARQHRDQLLEGIKLLEQLPEDATDDDYALLQDQMDDMAPDVSRLAWGHKYFSLLFPDKLDDYHSADWQRFHLLKMLQLPPEGYGRYIGAGRFVSAAREVDLPLNQFTATLNAVQSRLHRYWRVGTKDGSSDVSHWQMMQDSDCIAIGWNKLGDLSWVTSKRDTLDRLKHKFNSSYPDKTPATVGRSCSQIAQFIDAINEGDIVLAANGNTILGIGRVVGQYRYEADMEFPHQRPIEWLDLGEWKMPSDEGLRSTVRELKKYDENIIAVETRIQSVASPVKSQTTASNVKRNIRLDGVSGRIQSVLERKGQVILYGPPGTGKTYWAELSVNDLAAISAFGKRFNDLLDSEKLVVTGEGQSQGMVRLCCFHPAYGYEDFLEGYRPHLVNGQMAFELRDGVFKQLCDDAKNTPERNFYLIVDEINRGDIPRIFGELLTTLEKDKRGKGVVLPVSKDVFRVPRNVFLIGTMNTADRSISLLDAALRRRFGFIEMMPDGQVLANTSVSGIPLNAWFNALNERIRLHVGRDARNLQIGHSYLMQLGSPIKDIAALKRAIRDDIIPLLEEYCYEDYGTLATILGTDLVDTGLQRIRLELFEDEQQDNLVQVLSAMFPEMMTSSEAMISDDSPLEDGSGEDDDNGADAE